MPSNTDTKDCSECGSRLETKRGNYKTQQFTIVKPYCPLCEVKQN